MPSFLKLKAVSRASSIALSSAVYAVGQLLTLSAISHFAPEALGAYGYYFAISTTLMVVLNMQFRQLVPVMSEDEFRPADLMLSKIQVAVFVLVICLTVVASTAGANGYGVFGAVLLLARAIDSFSDFAHSIFIRDRRESRILLSRGIGFVLLASLTGVGILVNNKPLILGACIASFALPFFAVDLPGILAKHQVWSGAFSCWRPRTTVLLLLGVTGAIDSLLATFPRILFGVLGRSDSVAQITVLTVAPSLAGLFLGAAFASLSHLARKERLEQRGALKRYLTLSAIVVASGWIIGMAILFLGDNFIPRLLFGAIYAPSPVSSWCIALFVLTWFGDVPFVYLLMSLGVKGGLFAVRVVAGVSGVVASLLALVSQSATDAGMIGIMVASVVRAGGDVLLLKRALRIRSASQRAG
jgi:hypothetical protein